MYLIERYAEITAPTIEVTDTPTALAPYDEKLRRLLIALTPQQRQALAIELEGKVRAPILKGIALQLSPKFYNSNVSNPSFSQDILNNLPYIKKLLTSLPQETNNQHLTPQDILPSALKSTPPPHDPLKAIKGEASTAPVDVNAESDPFWKQAYAWANSNPDAKIPGNQNIANGIANRFMSKINSGELEGEGKVYAMDLIAKLSDMGFKFGSNINVQHLKDTSKKMYPPKPVTPAPTPAPTTTPK